MSVSQQPRDQDRRPRRGRVRARFRSEITPVELARRLVREMDRHRASSLSSTFVPNEYVVWLSPADRALRGDRGEPDRRALRPPARARAPERLALPSRPLDAAHRPRLSLGECGIEARLASTARPGASGGTSGEPPRRAAADDPRRLPAPARGEALAAAPAGRAARRSTAGAWSAGPGAVIGRSSDCDIVIAAQEVSRRHAEIVPDAGRLGADRPRLDQRRPPQRPAREPAGARCSPAT